MQSTGRAITRKMSFDLAAGLSESSLNDMISRAYKAIYPDFLRDSVTVNKDQIATVDYDIQEAPTVSLLPSLLAKNHVKSGITKHLKDLKIDTTKVKDKSALLDIASSATFTGSLSKVSLAINWTNKTKKPTKITASLCLHATVIVDASKSTFSVKLLNGTVDVNGSTVLNDLLNNLFVPLFLNYIQQRLKPMRIPVIKYKSLMLSTPLPVIQQNHATAFSSLGSTPSTIPSPMPWPNDGAYIAVDAAAIKAATGLVFPIGPQGNFQWKIFSGHIGATINQPSDITINSNGTVGVTIPMNISCQLTATISGFHVSFGPSATATPTIEFRFAVDDNEIKIVPIDMPKLGLHFDWGIPTALEYLLWPFEKLLGFALDEALGSLIVDALKDHMPSFEIPTIPINFHSGNGIIISFDDIKPGTFQGSLLIFTTDILVSKKAMQ